MIQYSVLSGINSSVITSILCVTVFLVALFFFVIFNEALGWTHMLGMILLMGCVILNSIQPDSDQLPEGNTTIEGEVQERISVLIPIGIAIFTAFVQASAAVVMRYYNRYSLKTFQFTLDSFIPISTIFTGIFIHEHFFVQPYTLA
jgi:drug/metabolite transporter (DMT)-like permease